MLDLGSKKPAPAQFKVGDTSGQIIVKEVIGHTYKHTTKKQWWYVIECSCGEIEEVTQQTLQHKIACKKCMTERQKRGTSSIAAPIGIPNFARIRLK